MVIRYRRNIINSWSTASPDLTGLPQQRVDSNIRDKRISIAAWMSTKDRTQSLIKTPATAVTSAVESTMY